MTAEGQKNKPTYAGLIKQRITREVQDGEKAILYRIGMFKHLLANNITRLEELRESFKNQLADNQTPEELDQRIQTHKAMQQILTSQQQTLESLACIWVLPLPELIQLAAQTTNKVEDNSEFAAAKKQIKGAALEILREKPLVKRELIRRLQESTGFNAHIITFVLATIMTDDKEIEAGWALNFSSTKAKSWGGVLWKLKETPLPERAVFFKGMSKSQASRIVRENIF